MDSGDTHLFQFREGSKYCAGTASARRNHQHLAIENWVDRGCQISFYAELGRHNDLEKWWTLEVLTDSRMDTGGCMHPYSFRDMFGEEMYQELLARPRVPSPYPDDENDEKV